MSLYKKILVLAILIIVINRVASACNDTIYIVQRSWHTGIVLKVDSVPEEIWPEIKQYKDYEFIDVGWGDEEFYQVPGFNLFSAMQAVLIPTPSTIIVNAVSNPSKTENYSRIAKLVISNDKFRALCSFIAGSYKRNEQGEIVPSTIFGPSNIFFLGKKEYHLFRTCNTWVAMALKHSGIDINVFGVITANQLFEQLE